MAGTVIQYKRLDQLFRDGGASSELGAPTKNRAFQKKKKKGGGGTFKGKKKRIIFKH